MSYNTTGTKYSILLPPGETRNIKIEKPVPPTKPRWKKTKKQLKKEFERSIMGSFCQKKNEWGYCKGKYVGIGKIK